MLNLIMFGPPGSGKGTQAQLLAQKYNLEHISTGDLLRAERANKTPLGLEANEYMSKGLYVPDEVVIGMISNKLDERLSLVNGFIFDGFPRTTAQATALDELLSKKNTAILRILSLKVSNEEVVKRLLNRGKTSGRTDDSNIETINRRTNEYQTKTKTLLDYYAQKVVEIKGEGDISDIAASLALEVEKLIAVTKK